MRCPSNRMWRTVISLRVSVPVLSVQITEVAPSVSTAGSLRITALRAAIRCTPIASVMVMTAGSPSGITPTDSATTASSASLQSKPRASVAKAKSAAAQASTTKVKLRAKRSIWRRSGGVAVSTSWSSRPIRPISVRGPVATTTPTPCPVAASVPE